MVSKKILTDSETLALHLLSAYIGYKLGLLSESWTWKKLKDNEYAAR